MLGGQRIPLSKQETPLFGLVATATASIGQMTLTLAAPPIMKSGSYVPVVSGSGSYVLIVSKDGRAG